MAATTAMLLLGGLLVFWVSGGSCAGKSAESTFLEKLNAITENLSKRAKEPGCGATPQLSVFSSGTVSSPTLRSGKYPSRRDCLYHIQVPQGKNIKVTFEKVDLEYHEECGYDYVKFYDGSTKNDPPLKKVCGNWRNPMPSSFETTGRDLLIEFHSDRDTTDTGFKVRYTSKDLEVGCADDPQLVTFESGTVTNPSVSGYYPYNRLCQYQLQVPLGKKIRFTFHTIDMEYEEECGYDYLRFYEGTSKSGKLLGKYCGTWKTMPAPLESSTNSVLIVFHSDKSERGTGFKFDFQSFGNTPAPSPSPAPSGSCGITQYSKRISSGTVSEEHAWPWLVHLHTENPYNPGYVITCGGSLIDSEWVLTAAHCLEVAEYQSRITDPSAITVRLAEHITSDSDFIKRGAAKIIYPKGRTEFGIAPHDVALIKLDSPVPNSAEVNTVCMPSSSGQFSVGQKCMVAGWGKIRGGDASPILLETDLDIISEEDCHYRMGTSKMPINEDLICGMVEKTNKAACQGDSGGALVCLDGGRYYIAGIVSYIVECGKVDYATPSVFARVTSYSSWISETIKNN